MYTVKQLLQDKGNAFWFVTSETSVYDALQVMAEKNVGAVLVIDGERLSGVFSERDYARKGILHDKHSKQTRVGELMTREVFYVAPADTVEYCMSAMTDKHIRHMPVIDEGRVAGIISIGDVVKHTISEQEVTIQQLKKYIAGEW